ncbi:MAG: carbohydrate ABC transporter permease [Spirochaetaceae bacterium]|nr:carbohydrate ABC transporter permease [Spirochaetaceae bacterium]MBR4824082.1 carbohydrate ABC transporter permease [Spirochaetaceae bacterium]
MSKSYAAESAPVIHHYKIKRRKPNRSLGGDIGVYSVVFFFAFIMVFPMIYSICQSFKPLDELLKFPPTVFPRNPTTDNFSDLFVIMSQSWVPFSRYIFNTLFVTVVGTFGHVIIASMAAYVLAKYRFPLGDAFFRIVVVALMFVGYVTFIPNYIIMCRLHIVDTYWAIILPAFVAPMGLFLMKQFMEGFPMAIIEAAKIDGAHEWKIFMNLVMPNVKPAWLTISIFSIQGLWNNQQASVIYSENKKMLAYALQQILLGGIARQGPGAAVTVVTLAVPIIFFIFSQSQILETMATSGLKD